VPSISTGITKSALYTGCKLAFNKIHSAQQQQQQQQQLFNGPLSGTTWLNQYQKGKTNLDLLEQEIVSGSGVSRAICKSAHCPRQITMPVPYHPVFLQAGCPSCHPANSIQQN